MAVHLTAGEVCVDWSTVQGWQTELKPVRRQVSLVVSCSTHGKTHISVSCVVQCCHILLRSIYTQNMCGGDEGRVGEGVNPSQEREGIRSPGSLRIVGYQTGRTAGQKHYRSDSC